MKSIILLACMLLTANLLIAKKKAVLSGIMSPAGLLVEKERLYVHESATIYIYSSGDFRLLKKFGQKGEGPGEFKLDADNQIFLHPAPGGLMVNSVGRISYFTGDGNFIEEIKNHSGLWLKPLHDAFVGMKKTYNKKNLRSRTVWLFNKELKPVKEIYGEKDGIQPRLKTVDAVSWPSSAIYRTYGGKLFINNRETGKIHLYDRAGNKLYDIAVPTVPVKMTDQLKAKYVKFYKEEDPYWRARWERMKSWYRFPETLPPAWDFRVKDNNIFIVTHREKEGAPLCLVLDLEGKLLKKAFLPLVTWDVMGIMPYDFGNGKLYQCVENEETEQWELHVHQVK